MTEAQRRAAGARSPSSRPRASSPTASCSTASTTTCGMARVVRTIVKGDQKVLSVAAASVVAKVTRDAIMADESEHYPGVRLRFEPRVSGARSTSARSPATDRRRSTAVRGSSWTTASGAASRVSNANRACSPASVRCLTRPGTRSSTHAIAMRGRTVRDLFAAEPDRAEMHVEAAGWYLDYAKHRVDARDVAPVGRPRRGARAPGQDRRDVRRRARQRHRGPGGAARRAAHARGRTTRPRRRRGRRRRRGAAGAASRCRDSRRRCATAAGSVIPVAPSAMS